MSTLIYHFQNLVKALTCFENPDKPSPIDSVLTKFPKSFIDTPTVETGLLDFHKLRQTIFKMQKSKSKNCNIEKLQKFSEWKLLFRISQWNSEYNDYSFNDFCSIFVIVLNIQALVKEKKTH